MKPDPAAAVSPRPVRTAKAKFTEVVAVCAKCAKRQGLPKRAVRDLLKGGLKQVRPRMKLRIVQTGCLGPCPKHLVAVVTGASVAEGRILLIDPTAPASEVVGAVLQTRTAVVPLPPEPGIGDGRGEPA